MKFKFDEYLLDTDQFELRDRAGIVAVEPKVLDFLALLVRNPGRVLTKDEIIDQIWDGRIVSEATVSGCVKAARRAVGDNGRDQNVIKTVHGRGFRLVADVKNADAPTAKTCVRPGVFVQPSLLILPARNYGGGTVTRLAAVIDGRLIQGLTRVPFLTVVSRRAAKELGGASLEHLRQNMGIGYVLDVELLENGDQIDTQLELSETRGGAAIWNQRLSVSSGQNAGEQLLAATLSKLEPVLNKAILDRLRADPTANDARPLIIEALNTMSLHGWHGASFSQAETLLRQAVDLDPDFAVANATLALVLALGQKVGFADPSEALVKEAVELADTALSQDDTNSVVLGLAGCALADAGHVKRAMPILNRAIEDDPNNAQALAALGSAYLHEGKLDKAAAVLEKSVDISPMDKRLVIWRSVLAIVYMQQGNLDAALLQAEKAVAADDRTYFSRIVLTGIQLQRDDIQAAKVALADCLRIKPNLALDQVSSIVGHRIGPSIIALVPQAR